MSVKSILAAKLARFLNDSSAPPQELQVTNLRTGVLEVETLPYGRRGKYMGLDKMAQVLVLNGDFNVSEAQLRELVDCFLPQGEEGEASRLVWADLARWHVAQRTASGTRVTIEAIAKSVTRESMGAIVSDQDAAAEYPAVKTHLDNVAARHKKAYSELVPLSQVVDQMVVAFSGQPVGARGLLRVTMDSRAVVQGSVGPEALVKKEFDNWVKRFKDFSKGGTKGGALVMAAKIGGACAVAFGALYAYGAYLQTTAGVGTTIAPSGVSAAPGRLATPPMVTALNEDELRARAYGDRLKGGKTDGTFDTPTTATIDDYKISSIASLTPETFAKIKGANALPMRKSGDPVFAFSNPTCSACQHLETQLDQLAADSNPVIIPVAFDEQAMRIGTAIMCSPDPEAAWRTVMGGGTLNTPLCLDGLKKMEKNSMLFADLGFNATPTIVATDGRAMIGSVAAPALHKWMRGPL